MEGRMEANAEYTGECHAMVNAERHSFNRLNMKAGVRT